MKKLIFVALLLLSGAVFTNVFASEDIPMHIVDKGGIGGGNTLAPARPWYISQDGYVLTLPALADDYMFELRDEDDVVVYTTFLPAGTTIVVLPSTLSGDFEIRLVADTYYYRGYIDL